MALTKLSVSCLVEEYNLICKKAENTETFVNLMKAINHNFTPISEDEYKQFMNLIKNLLFILNRIKPIDNHRDVLNVILSVLNKTDKHLNDDENIKIFNNFLIGFIDYLENISLFHVNILDQIKEVLEKVSFKVKD
jgi:hypothetical protein